MQYKSVSFIFLQIFFVMSIIAAAASTTCLQLIWGSGYFASFAHKYQGRRLFESLGHIRDDGCHAVRIDVSIIYYQLLDPVCLWNSLILYCSRIGVRIRWSLLIWATLSCHRTGETFFKTDFRSFSENNVLLNETFTSCE